MSFTIEGTILKKYTGDDDIVIIPDGITEIYMFAFSWFRGRKIVIPEGVKKIGQDAFSNSKNLKEINIPDTVEQIDRSAFSNVFLDRIDTSSLEHWFNIDFGELGGNPVRANTTVLFNGEELGTDIIIPECFTKIKRSAFSGFTKIESVKFAGKVTEIGDHAFYYCTQLKDIILPDTVKYIGDGAFSDCHSLLSITIPKSVEHIGKEAFSSCYDIKEIVIPENVKEIGEKAFYFSNLQKITILNKNITIGEGACSHCDKLQEVILSDGILTIPTRMFEKSALTGISIPQSVNKIGWDAFNGTRLEKIYIPDGVQYIGSRALLADGNDIEISLPGSVEEIWEETFPKGSKRDNKTVNIIVRGSKVSKALSSCLNKIKNYVDIVFSEMEVNAVPAQYRRKMTEYWAERWMQNETIPSNLYSAYAKYMKAHKTEWLDALQPEHKSIILWMLKEKIVKIDEIEELIRKAGEKDLRDLLPSILDYQNTNFSLDDYEKQMNSEIKKIQKDADIIARPDSAEFIRKYWSRKGSRVKQLKKTNSTVMFPEFIGKEKITGIEDSFAFENDGKRIGKGIITDIYIPESYTYIGTYAFIQCGESVRVHVPNLEAWMKMEVNTPGTKLELVIGEKESDELILPGDIQEIASSQFSHLKIRRIILEEGITTIGENAFSYCSDVDSISLPKSLSSIGNNAFLHCNPKEVHLESIHEWINATHNATVFGEDTDLFLNGEKIVKLTIPEGETRVNANSFKNWERLLEVFFPESLEFIGQSAFEDCSGLKTLLFPKELKTIESSAFSECSNLSNVSFPRSLRGIGRSAFYNCHNLHEIEIPDCVAEIGSGAFTSLCIGNKEPVWKYIVIPNLKPYMLSAFDIGTVIYTKGGSNMIDNMEYQFYRIRPLDEYQKEMVSLKEYTPLKGMTFTVDEYMYLQSKKEITAYVQNCGGIYTGPITKTTTHLISDSKELGTAKHHKAVEKGLSVVSAESFFKMSMPKR